MKTVSPGPGDYVTKNEFGKNAPKIKMIGQKVQKGSIEEIPGPGAYRTHQPRNGSPSYQIGKAPKFPKANGIAPGPGDYESRSSHQISPHKR